MKCAALSRDSAHSKLTAVVMHHTAANRKTYASACIVVLRAKPFENLKNPFGMFFLDTNAVVLDGHHPITALPDGRNKNHRGPVLTVFQCVADEVQQQWHQLGAAPRTLGKGATTPLARVSLITASSRCIVSLATSFSVRLIRLCAPSSKLWAYLRSIRLWSAAGFSGHARPHTLTAAGHGCCA